MPKMYVTVGVPGSGKSTWIANQEWAKNCAYISTDRIVERYARFQGKSYSEFFGLYMPRAVNFMVKQVKKARDQGKDIVWDQTSTTVESRARKFRLCPEYEAIAVVFKTPPKEELDRRLASRPGKEIPEKVVNDMIHYFTEPTIDEGFKEIWYAENVF
jgi:predicted kinase